MSFKPTVAVEPVSVEPMSSPSPNPPKPTPLPKRQFGILLAIRFSGPVSFSILFPFVYFMIRDFQLSDDKRVIGIYVGLLTSCFALAQCVSSVVWGTISDRIGRRPVILSGLLGSSITMALFGLSPTLTWAVVTRTLAGLLNGNMGVIKTMAAELTDDTNRAQGFTLLPLVFGLGSIAGPMLGGFLSNPATKFPSIFGGIQFLIDFPYFLPCGISAALSFLLFLFAYFQLEETLDSNWDYQCCPSNTNESTSLLNSDSLPNQYGTKGINDGQDAPNHSVPKRSWWVIAGFMLLNLQFVMLDELFPLWAATPLLNGGLGFESHQIGTVLSIGGLALILFQLSFYPRAQSQFGTLPLFRYGFFASAAVIPLFPLVATLPSHTFLWPTLLFTYCLLMGCRVTLFTSSNILLAETCPNRRILGRVNGIAQSLSSLMRGLGPILIGTLFSLSLHLETFLPSFPLPIIAGLAWWAIALLAIGNSSIPNTIQALP